MSFFEWSDNLSVDNQLIDTQHQILIGYINEFYDAGKDNPDIDTLVSIFEKIIAYTYYHFRNEEDLMAKNNYPKLSEHKESHHNLFKMVAHYKEKLMSNEPSYHKEIMEFLKNWLTHHIQKIDKEYSPYIKD